jgi:hypothetical protein
VVLHQRQLAGGLVLVQGQHGDRRRQLAVHAGFAVLGEVVYSNCTTANTVLPLTPATVGLATVSSEVPSGESEKNWRGLPATLVSMIGLLLMS